jgi:hypothetical protein
MSTISHQTIKLSKGKHTSAEEGACVMELASMLAGEQFTDHPACACPVIGSFLRAYNDSIDDDRRQDLYRYASQIVDTRGSSRLQQARAERLFQWAYEMHLRRWPRRMLPSAIRGMGVRREPSIDTIGTHTVHAISRHSASTHAEALALLDQLLALGRTDPSGPGFTEPVAVRPKLGTRT